MYEQFFGLRETPFSVTPNPKFVFLSARHRNALAGLTYAILSRKRFILLTGDIGTGKTTLVSTALRFLPPDRAQFSVIVNPTLSAAEVLEATLSAFGIKEIPASKVQRLAALERLLESDDQQGRIPTLIVDEAHKLTPEALEEIRLLGNLVSLQIVLVGQNELVEILNREELRSLKQRIALRLMLEPLSAIEVEQYIAHRWTKAGGRQPPPFSPEVLAVITARSRGIPRLINTICDNALLSMTTEKDTEVSVRHIVEAATALCLSDPNEKPAVSETHVATDDDPEQSTILNSNGNRRWRIASLGKLLS